MKQKDIDKKIGMPNVDAEWAKFEREVINPKTASRKTLYWGIGIAASIALAAGIFLFGDNTEKSQQTIAQQNTHTIQTSSAEKTIVETPVESIASPEKDEPVRIETKQRPSTELLAEATPPTTEEAVNDELQGHIAGLNGNDIPDSVRQARRDSVETERNLRRDSMLIVVNGSPILGGWRTMAQHSGLSQYLYKQHQLLSDGDLDAEWRIINTIQSPYRYGEEERKHRCFETYGECAKYGVVEVITIPDTYCDDYINKNPNLKEERHHIEGYVYDENNKPLADTWVQIKNKGIGAATDSKGYFSIWLPQTDVELKASHIGYVPCVVKTIKPMLTIQLKSATQLREVKVTPKRNS